MLRPNVGARWYTVSSNSLNYLTNSSPPDPMPSTPFNLNSILSKAECLSIRLKTDDAPLGTSWSGVHMKNYPSPHPSNKTTYSLEIFVANVLFNVLFRMTQKARAAWWWYHSECWTKHLWVKEPSPMCLLNAPGERFPRITSNTSISQN